MIVLRSEYYSFFLRNGWAVSHMRHIVLSSSPCHSDHSPRIASLPRHSGLFQKNMCHLMKTFATSLRGGSWRPTSKWVNYRYEYSKFLVKKADGESGYTNLRRLPVFYFMPLFPTMISGLPIGLSRCVFIHCLRRMSPRGCRHG